MKKDEINEKMEQSVKQGYIYVTDVDGEIIKVSIDGWNKKYRCILLTTNCGLQMPIGARNYGRKWYGWALTKEELETK